MLFYHKIDVRPSSRKQKRKWYNSYKTFRLSYRLIYFEFAVDSFGCSLSDTVAHLDKKQNVRLMKISSVVEA